MSCENSNFGMDPSGSRRLIRSNHANSPDSSSDESGSSFYRNSKKVRNNWMRYIEEHPEIIEEAEKFCEMMIEVSRERVKYIFRPTYRNKATKYRFKITFHFDPAKHIWRLQRGFSFVPPTVTLRNRFGTDNEVQNPLSKYAQEVLLQIKDDIMLYMDIILKMEEIRVKFDKKFPDIDLNYSITKVRLNLQFPYWPKFLERTSTMDKLLFFFTFDKDFTVVDIKFEYTHREDKLRISRRVQKQIRGVMQNLYCEKIATVLKALEIERRM